eukprot:359344-Chlamydomonas_euryale.AAC.4
MQAVWISVADPSRSIRRGRRLRGSPSRIRRGRSVADAGCVDLRRGRSVLLQQHDELYWSTSKVQAIAAQPAAATEIDHC